MYHLLLVICSNNVSILQPFRDITTFPVHMTACDLEKSFRFNKSLNYRPYIVVIVLYFEVWELERFQTAKVTFKVTQGHGYWCHSIDHIL